MPQRSKEIIEIEYKETKTIEKMEIVIDNQ